MSEDSIEFSLSIAEQRAVGFIPAWSLAFLNMASHNTQSIKTLDLTVEYIQLKAYI